MNSLPCRQGEAHPSPPADDKTATSPFAAQVWRGVTVRSRWSKAHELAAMRELVDRLVVADLAYAVGDVSCDSSCKFDRCLDPNFDR